MNSLLIIGAGSFSTEADELARLLVYKDIVFLDDNSDKAMSTPVIGSCPQSASKALYNHTG